MAVFGLPSALYPRYAVLLTTVNVSRQYVSDQREYGS
jgi:hypothetical protein